MTTGTNLQPAIRPVPLGLFPTLGSLQDVVDYADAQLPILTRNEITSILMAYHNTLLKVLAEQREQAR